MAEECPYLLVWIQPDWIAAPDISDVTEWVLAILADRALHERALENGTAVIPGLSTIRLSARGIRFDGRA